MRNMNVAVARELLPDSAMCGADGLEPLSTAHLRDRYREDFREDTPIRLLGASSGRPRGSHPPHATRLSKFARPSTGMVWSGLPTIKLTIDSGEP
jgi:hypothetical protein